MSKFTDKDHEFMARAIRIARHGLYTAHPNPRVGCVLVNDGRIVAEAFHRKTGEAHAESRALAIAGDGARGSTAYVTLEPCSHYGKTPPCSEALISAGVSNVVIAMRDPNPKVAGSGIGALENAGLNVQLGLLGDEALALNEGFASRMSRGRPFVRLKIASSLDGRTAMSTGESQWITGTESRRDVQRLRASSGAVMTGIDTVVGDDPALTVRDDKLLDRGEQPMRVVVDSRLRMAAKAKMLGLPGSTIVFCIDDSKKVPLENAGAKVINVSALGGRTDLGEVLKELAVHEINDVLVECGPTLAGKLLELDLVDELVIYQAPHIMGSETRGIASTPTWAALSQKMNLAISDLRNIGNDLRITARRACR